MLDLLFCDRSEAPLYEKGAPVVELVRPWLDGTVSLLYNMDTMMPAKKVLSTEETKRELGLTDRTIRRLRAEKKLRVHHREGRRVFYDAASVYRLKEHYQSLNTSSEETGEIPPEEQQEPRLVRKSLPSPSLPHHDGSDSTFREISQLVLNLAQIQEQQQSWFQSWVERQRQDHHHWMEQIGILHERVGAAEARMSVAESRVEEMRVRFDLERQAATAQARAEVEHQLVEAHLRLEWTEARLQEVVARAELERQALSAEIRAEVEGQLAEARTRLALQEQLFQSQLAHAEAAYQQLKAEAAERLAEARQLIAQQELEINDLRERLDGAQRLVWSLLIPQSTYQAKHMSASDPNNQRSSPCVQRDVCDPEAAQGATIFEHTPPPRRQSELMRRILARLEQRRKEPSEKI